MLPKCSCIMFLKLRQICREPLVELGIEGQEKEVAVVLCTCDCSVKCRRCTHGLLKLACYCLCNELLYPSHWSSLQCWGNRHTWLCIHIVASLYAFGRARGCRLFCMHLIALTWIPDQVFDTIVALSGKKFPFCTNTKIWQRLTLQCTAGHLDQEAPSNDWHDALSKALVHPHESYCITLRYRRNSYAPLYSYLLDCTALSECSNLVRRIEQLITFSQQIHNQATQ